MEDTPSDCGRDVRDWNLWVYSVYRIHPQALSLKPDNTQINHAKLSRLTITVTQNAARNDAFLDL